MISTESTATDATASSFESRETSLRHRLDELLGCLHALTKRRDTGEITLQASLPIELALVVELGQIQDRLRLLGFHSYDGCRECRPFSCNPGPNDKENVHDR